jgi:hypothetical protein
VFLELITGILFGVPIYTWRVLRLSKWVSGRVVSGVECGTCGYVLRFADSGWLAIYPTRRRLKWRRGVGDLPGDVRELVNSRGCRDVTLELGDTGVGHPDERTLAEFVGYARGQRLLGIIPGCNGRPLEFSLWFEPNQHMGHWIRASDRGVLEFSVGWSDT